MKKTVLKFGLISGAIAAAFMLGTLPFMDRIGFDKGPIVGYTGMILSFMLVFFGIRSYREHIGEGEISFWRALWIGVLITLISSVCYVITWEIVYFKFMPDFWQKLSSYSIEQLRTSGASAAQIEAKRQELQHFGVLYRNPLFNAAVTLIEPLPVGLIITLISALILRKKRRSNNDEHLVANEALT